ncbi:GNAT family N-acetyltransferase [Streptacidiphilus sp. P02-A3a]|uniref:GNAT family N-acetyltransferase n=1 Tax=Streptacidiphilus sp. P02-A3a TaxID=2704468 RepID=UPI0015FC3B74|nr:GNAT family N-acetyltransferase [Streptacidiphilus sp. P02-A3a]QMU71493.1 GNAT family N-acetyltransferase [Streptacidiphilus sp. P02-A3a]
MNTVAYAIRRVASEEWRELRELRLNALREAPTAFSTRYADAAAEDDSVWRRRAAHEAESPTAATFVATTEDGHWVGMTGAGPLELLPGYAHVHGVYVAAAHRGGRAGLARRLMAAGIDWARTRTDAAWLTLGVHEDNEHARGFYRRIGFSDTGKVVPYALDPAQQVHIMGYDAFRWGRS